MQSRLLPVIFYTTISVTLIAQLVTMDILAQPVVGARPPQDETAVEESLSTVADPVFWDASSCTDCYDLQAERELTIDELYGMVGNWSQYSREKLTNLLLDWQSDGDRLRLVFRESKQDDRLHFTQLTHQDIRTMLSVLSRRS